MRAGFGEKLGRGRVESSTNALSKATGPSWPKGFPALTMLILL